MKQENYTCHDDRDFSTVLDLYNLNEIETFTLAVWVSSIVHTGLLPPHGPYDTWIKMTGNRIHHNCTEPAPYSREFRTHYSIQDTGTTTGTFGWVDYQYGWPGLCWVGEFYEY